ncbi:MAG: ImmA/IrrE family metallo-endopeptidase [Halieaceae bacterium]|nr:ImmA/IrrE family metallo-endopeptidase [Halieaceae bacterium]
MGKRLKARSGRELRPLVESLLEAERVEKPPVPVERIARLLGAEVRYLPFEGELAGMLIRDEAGRGIVIGVNSLHHLNRRRFTIAHECGHLQLHKGQRAYVDRSPLRINRRDEVSSQAMNVEEIEANRFAAELLMPYDMIVEDLMGVALDIEDEGALKELGDRYRVSIQALTLRLRSVFDNALF